MTKSLMPLAALLALCLPASAQDTKVCGAPVALNDGWSITSQADVGIDRQSSASSTPSSWIVVENC